MAPSDTRPCWRTFELTSADLAERLKAWEEMPGGCSRFLGTVRGWSRVATLVDDRCNMRVVSGIVRATTPLIRPPPAPELRQKLAPAVAAGRFSLQQILSSGGADGRLLVPTYDGHVESMC